MDEVQGRAATRHEGEGDVMAVVRDPARLAAVQASRLLDSGVEEAFDRLTRLAVRLVGVPAAFVSLVDEHRDFYKSACGFGEPLASARELTGPTLCHFAILSSAPLVIDDTVADARYRDVPTVTSLGIAAYVGIPIIIEGQPIGSFCAVDMQPRRWSDEDVQVLRELALSAQREIMLRTSERVARESSARLAVAMDAAQLGAWSHEIGSDQQWNAAETNRIFGRAPAAGAVRVEVLFASVHPDDRPMVRAAFEASAVAGSRLNIEYRIHWPDGSERWVCIAAMRLAGDDGGPASLVGTVEDITQRKLAELLSRAGSERLRAFIEAVPLLAWMNESDGTPTFFNQRWYDYTGEDGDEAGEGRWMSILHPDDAPRMREVRDASIASRTPYELEVRLRRRDGEYRWHLARVAPSLDESGTVLGWAGGALDIDDRRRLEADLRESEARFRLVQDASTDGSVLLHPVLDASGTVMDFVFTYANASAHRILVDEQEAIVGRSLADAFPDSRERIPVYARVLATGEPFQSEIFYLRREVRRGLRLVAVRVDSQVHVAFADLTERLRAAEERERLLEAERAAHAEADHARREAEQANAVKAQFLATMSHELRTPLNAIGGYSQLIELGVHGPVTPGQADALARIQRSQKHLLGLITEVLNYAKLEAGAVTWHLADVPAITLVREVEALVAPQAHAKSIALIVEPSSAELVVVADAEKARQVVLNLLSNAVKFTPRGGRVTVSCTEHDAGDRAPMVAIAVEDTGRGIRPDHLDRVFDPFVQVGRELTSEQGGTGLGLAISRDLARGMSGDITATSREGEGSLFVLTLPRA